MCFTVIAYITPVRGQANLAKGEPRRGCYFSAFVGPDFSIRKELFKGGGNLEDALGRILNKRIAVQWLYFDYENPAELNAYLNSPNGYKNRPVVLQAALEPRKGIDTVKDDSVLHAHAQAFAAMGRPVFLRFASEMNGNWTPFHKNPELYREKFKLVHDVMKKVAPNVIMIWCVGSEPHNNWEDYYPGDAYVDWVGVNFYSVLHHNNDPKLPADKESFEFHLDNIYKKFAARKPIAICEYAACREESLHSGTDRSEWAASKYRELMKKLPLKYPRIKMLGLFNVNTIKLKFGKSAPKTNNYLFSDSPVLIKALRESLSSNYYLSTGPATLKKSKPK